MSEKAQYIHAREKKNCKRGDHFFDPLSSSVLMTVERCCICGKKEYYNKAPDGSIDQMRYTKNHEVDLLQPFGKTKRRFEEVYGEPVIPKSRPDHSAPIPPVSELQKQYDSDQQARRDGQAKGG